MDEMKRILNDPKAECIKGGLCVLHDKTSTDGV